MAGGLIVLSRNMTSLKIELIPSTFSASELPFWGVIPPLPDDPMCENRSYNRRER